MSILVGVRSHTKAGIIALFATPCVFFLLGVHVTHAQEAVTYFSESSLNGTLAGLFQSGTLSEFVRQLFAFAVRLGGLFAVLRIAYGGWLYMVSEKAGVKDEAKKIIFGAIIGLVMLMAVVLVLNQINPRILNLNVDLQPIQETPVDPGTPPGPGGGTDDGYYSFFVGFWDPFTGSELFSVESSRYRTIEECENARLNSPFNSACTFRPAKRPTQFWTRAQIGDSELFCYDVPGVEDQYGCAETKQQCEDGARDAFPSTYYSGANCRKLPPETEGEPGLTFEEITFGHYCFRIPDLDRYGCYEEQSLCVLRAHEYYPERYRDGVLTNCEQVNEDDLYTLDTEHPANNNICGMYFIDPTNRAAGNYWTCGYGSVMSCRRTMELGREANEGNPIGAINSCTRKGL